MKNFSVFLLFFPLTDTAGKKMIDGKLIEEDISLSDILSTKESPNSNYIYIALVVARISNESFGDYLHQELFRYITKNYAPKEGRRYLAYAYTPEGSETLQLYGFVMERTATQTSNRRELYVRGGDITQTLAYRYYYEQLALRKRWDISEGRLDSVEGDFGAGLNEEIRRRNRIENPWGTEWGNPPGTRKAVLIRDTAYLATSPNDSHVDIVRRMTPEERDLLKPDCDGFYSMEKKEFYASRAMGDYLEGLADKLVGVAAHEVNR
jgi:hypothetical protein